MFVVIVGRDGRGGVSDWMICSVLLVIVLRTWMDGSNKRKRRRRRRLVVVVGRS